MKETGHVPMEEKPIESVALALSFLNLEIENENFLKE
jgi:hypothetical protein